MIVLLVIFGCVIVLAIIIAIIYEIRQWKILTKFMEESLEKIIKKM